MFPYFTAACYKGFGDDPDGFYGVYAKLFDQIAAEDIEFMDSPEEYEQIPKFGTSTSDYDTVVGPFYAYWQSYCTKKTYTWLCPHNINEIRDRRILREVEKETKKIAQKKRKERNDEIRALVMFVRKRDKRVHEYRKLLEAKAEQNRVKQQQHRLAQLRKNQQAAEEMQKNQSSIFSSTDHEEQLRQLEQAYGGTDSESDYDEDEDGVDSDVEDGDLAEKYYIDDLYCVACNKAFKNISSFENHESSKKHRDNLERLKKQMQQEEEQYVNEDQEVRDEATSETGTESADEIAATQKSNKKSKKSKKRNTQHKITNDTESEHELDNVESSLTDLNIGIPDGDKDAWSDDGGKKKKKAKSKKVNKKPARTVGESNQVGDEPTAMAKSVNKKLNNKSATTSKIQVAPEPTTDVNHTCVTCSSTFESKNKLFAHLKKTKHGVYIPKTEEKTSKRK